MILPLMGMPLHAENMVKLQKTFKFGKWKSIYNSEGDYAGRTVIQDRQLGPTRDSSRCVGIGIAWHGVNQSKHCARFV